MLSKYITILLLWPGLVWAAGPADNHFDILDYAPSGTQVDRLGILDASQALSNVITAANAKTSKGEPACVYLPAGIYRIVTPPPQFLRAGCVKGDGPTQTILSIDPQFTGDLFAWSEAWAPTTSGPTARDLTIRGSKSATNLQNALVFYDRNDEVFLDNIDIMNLHGRALYSGVTKNVPQAYMRESHMRSLRFFEDGAPGVPVVEFNSQGEGQVDGTNEIRISQMDIYGPHGPGVVIRNNSTGGVRAITFDALRIEGYEQGTSAGDLLTIGDAAMKGNVNNIVFTNLELIDPSQGYAAFHLTAAPGSAAPYMITAQGFIGGGIPRGQGLRIDAGRTSTFRFTNVNTKDTNIVIGRGVSGIVLDGSGLEAHWTYSIDPTSWGAISTPVLRMAVPAAAGK